MIDDLRQGVTRAGHSVLDCLESQQQEWADLYDIERQLEMAMVCIRAALNTSDLPAKQRRKAVEASARLIDAINEMDRESAAESAGKDGGAA